MIKVCQAGYDMALIWVNTLTLLRKTLTKVPELYMGPYSGVESFNWDNNAFRAANA